jgi:hypothetical protein
MGYHAEMAIYGDSTGKKVKCHVRSLYALGQTSKAYVLNPETGPRLLSPTQTENALSLLADTNIVG